MNKRKQRAPPPNPKVRRIKEGHLKTQRVVASQSRTESLRPDPTHFTDTKAGLSGSVLCPQAGGCGAWGLPAQVSTLSLGPSPQAHTGSSLHNLLVVQ